MEIKMKKICVIISLFLLMVSCDPEKCATLYIHNKTNKNLYIEFYKQNEINKELSVNKNSIKELFSKSCATGVVLLPDISVYDSILLIKNDSLLKTYEKDNNLKNNIYNWDDWIITDTKKYNYDYTFEITEEDISGN